MKGIQEVYIWANFHLCLICSSRVFKFKMFSYQQKVPFQAASGWFFGGSPLEFGQICFKFCLLIQCKVMHQIFDSFYSISKKWLNLGQMTDFLPHFQRFLVYALLRLIIYAPIFCQIKILMKIHNCGKFHQYRIQVKNLQMVSQQQKLPLQAASGWFLALTHPNVVRFF